MRKELNYRRGFIECKGRRFLCEFWIDRDFHLPSVRLSEMVKRPVRKHWFSRETEIRDVPIQIDQCWTDSDRVSWCEKRIDRYLADEEEQRTEDRRIEALCGKESCE